MSGLAFELQRAASVKGPRGEVLSWVGDIASGRSAGTRALRIRVKGRTYTHAHRGGKRRHGLAPPGAAVHMSRSSWRIAIVLEGVYTRNLSVAGALISLPGRILNRFNDM